MTIGHKSIMVEVVIPNHIDPSHPYVVRVQANKNHGICDIVQGTKFPQEIIDEKTKKKRTVIKFLPSRRISSVLSIFQGRQYNDPEVFENLRYTLVNVLNSN